jgi:hypothetical protein
MQKTAMDIGFSPMSLEIQMDAIVAHGSFPRRRRIRVTPPLVAK